MRSLIVDNYDSYTYNLYQLLGEVNGVAPTVVSNDAAAWDDLDLTTFDNIVISPGPGHPARPRDFGRCAEVIATTSLPLLGVCLGHQGIALAAGAQVGPAPTPRHGYLSRVRHDDDALFAGIPQGFVGVRYHSLCVRAPLPAELRATAWAEDDGVIMAVRHQHRPQWGVQFHPESVATQFGGRLLAKFLDLPRESRAHRATPASKLSAASLIVVATEKLASLTVTIGPSRANSIQSGFSQACMGCSRKDYARTRSVRPLCRSTSLAATSDTSATSSRVTAAR